MLTIEALIALILVILAFIAGKCISDSYNEKIISELQFQLRLSAAKQGVGYVAPPPRRRAQIGQPFMDCLKQNGRAVQKLDNQG